MAACFKYSLERLQRDKGAFQESLRNEVHFFFETIEITEDAKVCQ